MSFFQWKDEFDLGVHDMNDEHKELIKLMNKVHDVNESGASKSEILASIDDLGKYTVTHFSDEEAYMESIQYPELEVHKKIHEQLLKQFGQHQTDFRDGASDKVPEKFFQFLNLWLAAHIKGIDMKYANHAKGRKVA